MSTFKRRCRDSTVRKMSAMVQLSEALNGGSGLPFSSLIPIANIIKAIVQKDIAAFHSTTSVFKSYIAERNKALTLQDLPVIAEINFLEGFDSFISYIQTAEASQVEDCEASADVHSLISSIHNSPIRSISPKRRAPMRLDESREKEPMRECTAPMVAEQEEEEAPVKPNRKSARHLVDDGVKFACVFNGCAEELKTAAELAAHAENCMHKSDRVLVFRCSLCARVFSSDKSVKTHITRSLDCESATIKIDSEAKPGDETGGKKVKIAAAPGNSKGRESLDISIGGRNNRQSQVIKCPFKGCTYSNVMCDRLYVHVKNAHPDRTSTFKCLRCGFLRMSGKAIQNHVQTCNGARIELKLSKGTNQAERGRKARHSQALPTEVKIKRGRPSLKGSLKKVDEGETEVDVADIPVLEEMELDDDNDESMDVSSDEEMQEADVFNMSDESSDC